MAADGDLPRPGTTPAPDAVADAVADDDPETAELDVDDEGAGGPTSRELLRQVADTTGGIWDDWKDAAAATRDAGPRRGGAPQRRR